MAKVVVVTSGKGGVGKTTTSAAFATGLALRGYKTAVIDFDIGLRNLDIVLGCERRVVYDIVSVIKGEATLRQALIRDKHSSNLSILAASQTQNKDTLDLKSVGRIITDLRQDFDYIVCDSPAGIERGAVAALYYADEAIVVCNPEVSSVRDSDRIIGILSSKARRAKFNTVPVKEHLLVTRYDPQRVRDGEMLSVDDVQEILGIPMIGVIPESQDVLKSSNVGRPVTLNDECVASQAYDDALRRFCGESIDFRFITPEKKGFLSRLMPFRRNAA